MAKIEPDGGGNWDLWESRDIHPVEAEVYYLRQEHYDLFRQPPSP